VPCTTDSKQHTIRVPVTRDGSVIAGRMVAIVTNMYNSAGTKIHTDNTLRRIR
jgi:hypothetical protein